MKRSQFAVGCGIAWAVTATSSMGFAEDATTAQALFDQGKKAMAAHNYAEACPKLDESLRLDPALGTLLNLADCYEREGKLATAWSRFLELSAKARAAGQSERSRIGRERAAALAPKLSNVVIDVPAGNRIDGLEIRRDGAVVGEAQWGAAIPADPGAHAIEASAPGRKPWSDTVTVTGGAATATISVPALERIPEPPKPAPVAVVGPQSTTASSGSGNTFGSSAESPSSGSVQKTVGLVVGGVGVLGLGVGGVFGVLSVLKHHDASTECPSNPCRTSNGQSLWNDAVSFGNVSTIAFIAGGVAVAGGAVLWLTAPKGESQAASSAQLGIGPGEIQLRGRW